MKEEFFLRNYQFSIINFSFQPKVDDIVRSSWRHEVRKSRALKQLSLARVGCALQLMEF